MGISLQAYRCRVGCFNSNYFINTSSRQPTTTGSTSSPCWPGRLALIFTTTLCLALLAIAIYRVAEQSHQTLHSLPSTSTSGCSSSTPDWKLEAFFLQFFPYLPPWPPPWQCLGAYIVKTSYSSRRNMSTSEISIINEYHLLQSVSWTTAKQINCNARTINGNRKERGIKILHWNKGPSYLENKYNEVEAIIENHKPHVLGLSESNLRAEHVKSQEL